MTFNISPSFFCCCCCGQFICICNFSSLISKTAFHHCIASSTFPTFLYSNLKMRFDIFYYFAFQFSWSHRLCLTLFFICVGTRNRILVTVNNNNRRQFGVSFRGKNDICWLWKYKFTCDGAQNESTFWSFLGPLHEKLHAYLFWMISIHLLVWGNFLYSHFRYNHTLQH